jgi:hypothetical protein
VDGTRKPAGSEVHRSMCARAAISAEEWPAGDYWEERTVVAAAAPTPVPPAAGLAFFAGSRLASAVVPASKSP